VKVILVRRLAFSKVAFGSIFKRLGIFRPERAEFGQATWAYQAKRVFPGWRIGGDAELQDSVLRVLHLDDEEREARLIEKWLVDSAEPFAIDESPARSHAWP
jgi:hypothetical protein